MFAKTTNRKKALIAVVAVAAVVLGSTGIFALNAGQAFAQTQNQQSNGNNDRIARAAIVKDIRDHKGEWTGLTTVSHSLVPGIKILGVTEKSSDTVSITLAHVAAPQTDNATSIDNSPVTKNFTLVAIAGHDRAHPNAHLDGSTIVSSGWSGVTTVDVKLDGNGSLFDYHLIRAVAVEYTGSQ